MSDLRRNAGELVTQLEIESQKARAFAQELWLEQRALEQPLERVQAQRAAANDRADVIDRALAKAQSLLADFSDE